MEPGSADYCVCGHTYGWHSQDMNGPCLERLRSGAVCDCPHWRYPMRDLINHIEGAMLVEARLAKPYNPAAHDAWQLALECLEPLRAAIDRARRCEGSE